MANETETISILSRLIGDKQPLLLKKNMGVWLSGSFKYDNVGH